MREASVLPVGAFRRHRVGPLDRQGIDGPRDEHHQGQAHVKEIHFRGSCLEKPSNCQTFLFKRYLQTDV